MNGRQFFPGRIAKNLAGQAVTWLLTKTTEKATNNIKSCAAQLGLTVDSRMKMYMPKTEEKKDTMFDKFGG